MIREEREIAQNLRDAGCGRKEIETILGCWRAGDRTGMEKRIAACRQAQLDRLHESQKCIDRLDYLRYQLERKDGGMPAEVIREREATE